MTIHQRRSPVSLSARPVKTEMRDGWTVILEYEDEGEGPWLIDLSHRSRFDIQDGAIDQMTPWGLSIPKAPLESIFQNGVLINRMNRTQASVWHLAGATPHLPPASAFTDVTEAALLIALVGKPVFSIFEKLTAMDLQDPKKAHPFLLQGPVAHVPCQMVVFKRSADQSAVLWTCSRGYGHDMIHAVMDAGAEFGIRPAGENALSAVV